MNDKFFSHRSFLLRASAFKLVALFADFSDWATSENDGTYVVLGGWCCWARKRVNGKRTWGGYGSVAV